MRRCDWHLKHSWLKSVLYERKHFRITTPGSYPRDATNLWQNHFFNFDYFLRSRVVYLSFGVASWFGYGECVCGCIKLFELLGWRYFIAFIACRCFLFSRPIPTMFELTFFLSSLESRLVSGSFWLESDTQRETHIFSNRKRLVNCFIALTKPTLC